MSDKNYEDMSNLQLAAMVLAARGISHKIEHKTCFIDHGFIDGANLYTEFDPCNVWNDAGPIIADNKINIEWRDSLRLHPLAKGTGGNACHWSDENPLRAAMICFLKMCDQSSPGVGRS